MSRLLWGGFDKGEAALALSGEDPYMVRGQDWQGHDELYALRELQRWAEARNASKQALQVFYGAVELRARKPSVSLSYGMVLSFQILDMARRLGEPIDLERLNAVLAIADMLDQDVGAEAELLRGRVRRYLEGSDGWTFPVEEWKPPEVPGDSDRQ